MDVLLFLSLLFFLIRAIIFKFGFSFGPPAPIIGFAALYGNLTLQIIKSVARSTITAIPGT